MREIRGENAIGSALTALVLTGGAGLGGGGGGGSGGCDGGGGGFGEVLVVIDGAHLRVKDEICC